MARSQRAIVRQDPASRAMTGHLPAGSSAISTASAGHLSAQRTNRDKAILSNCARHETRVLIGGAINDEIHDFVNAALGTSVGKFDKVAKGPAARVEARIVR